MPQRSPQTILLTGATSAIGAALVTAYARPGVTLHLHGRNRAKLDAIVQTAQTQGAIVTQRSFDVRDSATLRAWVADCEKNGPLDLVISNAGMNINTGPDESGEVWEEAEALMAVNLHASRVLVDAVLPAMRARHAGQIALMSSLAGYFGLPVTPSYCASKAAIKAYGEALRGWLGKEGIGISVIMPGYVDSVMCREMPGPKPFLMQPPRAAALIRQGLARNQARISFPFPLNFGTWWLAVLPAAISVWIVGLMGYNGHHD
ncbi:SDR family NAD(P)-dependent oxidoreductase [Acidithiobacillus sulfurivorans]|uniref:SDR family NAD(P)-dependent oxidoreductase n=1 Tax=Acidithiobacillus sulfurivorans TaxID=1958756 RepID=A0ABS5ZZ07_9PROT|nr:SDR family NAD(P)-dependent oxidoreductase [Acidithiobacillus sulfurivorans]MBU2760404.1 SDR family NAD(P)-dependent oxidoreductase [Acidithiobacillus sulfurivorans]